MACIAVQASSELGMQLGWRKKPAMGLPQYSLATAAMPVRVRPNTRMSTGRGPFSSSLRWYTMTGALGKNSASEFESIIICMNSVFWFMAQDATVVCTFLSVLPPVGRKRIFPWDTSAFFLTKPFQTYSVQMVTSHPLVSAIPRASATKGCTSPLVPRVIMKTCLGYSASSSAGAPAGQASGSPSATRLTLSMAGQCGSGVPTTGLPSWSPTSRSASRSSRRSARGRQHSPMYSSPTSRAAPPVSLILNLTSTAPTSQSSIAPSSGDSVSTSSQTGSLLSCIVDDCAFARHRPSSVAQHWTTT
mmetsp:Transcript_89858/g.254630  ORF Transcript_89858/g.254630 Transcript_89858/m.254630 type:complete len:303 (+) Transcript_89858:1027-1935(+)